MAREDRDHGEQDTEEAWEQVHRREVGQGAVAAATDTSWDLLLVFVAEGDRQVGQEPFCWGSHCAPEVSKTLEGLW